MDIKRIFLVIFLFLTLSTAKIEIPKRKNENLASAVKKISTKIMSNSILNVILASSKPDSKEFCDSFMKVCMNRLKVRLRLHTPERIKNPQVASPRKYSVIIIATFRDFKFMLRKLISRKFQVHGHYIFVLTNGSFPEIPQIFYEVWKNDFYNVIAAYEDTNGHVPVLTFLPYRAKYDCFNTSPVLINKYVNGSFTNGLGNNIFPKKLHNMQKCSVRVASPKSWPPHTSFDHLPNGTLVGNGRDYDMISALAGSLNFSINFTYIGSVGYILPNGSAGGPPESVLKNESDIVLGDWWLMLNRLKIFDATDSYMSEKLVFVVKYGEELSSFEKLLYPLKITAWVSILSFLILVTIIIIVIKKQAILIQNFVFGVNVNSPYLNLVTGLLGQNLSRLPKRNFARFLLMNFLLFALVLRTVYQGKMFEIMKSNIKHSEPNSISDAIERGYELICSETTFTFSGLQNFRKVKIM